MSSIPQIEIEELLKKVADNMAQSGMFPSDVIAKTRIQVIHPEYWEVILLVPYKGTKAKDTRKFIEDMLVNKCGVEEDYCEYRGRQEAKQAYEWFFRHPHTPQDICDKIDTEIEAACWVEEDTVMPVPGKVKSNSDTVFMTLKDEYYKKIDAGNKLIEYRDFNQYYCDKLFPSGTKKQYIKFNRGYLSGAENQMVFKIDKILLVGRNNTMIPAVSDEGTPISSLDELPDNFVPTQYGIVLGKRIA